MFKKNKVSGDGEEYTFYEEQPDITGFITLSHLNNKSSVLCPENQDITSQYLALQQLDAHQRMISRAKGCIDTSAPKSLQSYRSIADKKKKKLWKQLHTESQVSGMNESGYAINIPSSSRAQVAHSEEDETESLNASSVNKGIQTGFPFGTLSSKTADKISWYLEALNQGELHSEPFIYMDSLSSATSQHFGNGTFPNRSLKKRIIKGDIMEWHKEHFVKPKKPFSPRILADKAAKSKLKDMRCYNPPFRIKKTSSSHSSDTFESYDDDDDEDDDETDYKNQMQKMAGNSSIEEETLMSRKVSKVNNSFNASLNPSLHYHSENHSDSTSQCEVLNRNEEDKYLDFLSKVTEDILRSGVYSDSAIQRAFDFHMQFYQDETNKEKLEALRHQVLEGLKISSDETEQVSNRRNLSLFSNTRPDTPPERESSDVLPLNNSFRSDLDLNLMSINELHPNMYNTNQASTDISSNKSAMNNLNELSLKDS